MALTLAHGSLAVSAWAQPPVEAAASPTPLSAAAPTPAPTLPSSVAQALQASGLSPAALSVWVQAVGGMGAAGVDASASPAPRLSHLAETPRRMASVMKLMTTGVALRTLGPAFTWNTAVALGGPLDRAGVLRGDVHIRASGDPSLDGMRLSTWLRQWRDAGLKEIRGDVRVDRSAFALPPHDPSEFDGQPLRPYNAGPDAWLLAHQATSVQLRPDDARKGMARVTLSPALEGVRLDAAVRLDDQSPCGDWRSALGLELGRDHTDQVVRLKGRYPRACGAQSWPLLWPQNSLGEHSARAWAAAWRQAGGLLHGQVRDGPWPNPAPEPWLNWPSPPLAEVVRDINKFSNNVMARQLFLTLGLPTDGRGSATLERARNVVTEHVRQATRSAAGGSAASTTSPCDGDALRMDNGSGLSRTESASAQCVGQWLAVLWADPTMPEWLASLPIAGVDGTARRMSGMPSVLGRAHLKTGSLDGVMAVAGVVEGVSGQRQLVVAVVNDPKADAARPVLRAVLEWAAQDTVLPTALPTAPHPLALRAAPPTHKDTP